MANIKIDNNKQQHFEKIKAENLDFSAVLENASKVKKWGLKTYLLNGLVCLAILGGLLALFNKKKNTPSTNKQEVKTELYGFAAPLEDHKVGFEQYQVKLKTDEPTEVMTKEGTKIVIPSQGLLNQDGSPVKGEITVKYRSFKDLKTIMQSGIPMVYDSAGVARVFESAGMFELYALQNDKLLSIAKGKSVEVQMTSNHLGDYFNQYYLDPETKAWRYTGKDTAGSVSFADVQVYEAALDVELQKLEASKPLMPKRVDEQKPFIKLNFNQKAYPELAAFKDVRFQIHESEQNFDADYAKESWSNVAINRALKSEIYNLCFSKKAREELCFKTTPVVSGRSFNTSKRMADKMLEQYNQKRAAIKKARAEAKRYLMIRSSELEAQKDSNAQEIAAREFIDTAGISIQGGRMVRANLSASPIRVFRIMGFGIWNCDFPSKVPNPVVSKLRLADQNGTILDAPRMQVYVVDIKRNMLYGHRVQHAEIAARYNNEDEPKNMLWATLGDRVYYYSADDFNTLEVGNAFTKTIQLNQMSAKSFVNLTDDEIFNL